MTSHGGRRVVVDDKSRWMTSHGGWRVMLDDESRWMTSHVGRRVTVDDESRWMTSHGGWWVIGGWRVMLDDKSRWMTSHDGWRVMVHDESWWMTSHGGWRVTLDGGWVMLQTILLTPFCHTVLPFLFPALLSVATTSDLHNILSSSPIHCFNCFDSWWSLDDTKFNHPWKWCCCNISHKFTSDQHLRNNCPTPMLCYISLFFKVFPFNAYLAASGNARPENVQWKNLT